MIYTVKYTSWVYFDFYRYTNRFMQAAREYNLVSMKSISNPKKILDIKVLSRNELEITFESFKYLTQGREANALWFFSHYLAENLGLSIYVNQNGKLLKSA